MTSGIISWNRDAHRHKNGRDTDASTSPGCVVLSKVDTRGSERERERGTGQGDALIADKVQLDTGGVVRPLPAPRRLAR